MKRKHAKYSVPLLALILILMICISMRLTPSDNPTGETGAPGMQTQPQNTAPSGTTSSDPTGSTTTPTQPNATDPSQTDPSNTDPSASQPATEPSQSTPPETTPTTQPPATNPPTTTPPTTPPVTQPGTDYIGSLYTRDQLMALSNEKFGYGPGPASKDQRAIYAVADQKRYEKYGANFIAPDNNCIYLTFDCGYEYTATDANGNKYRVTERILDVLKEKGVKGVFFVTMYYVKSQPDLVQRMIDEGHAVGNHSNNHPVMPDISIDEMVNEVMSLHKYVLDNFGYEMTLFRPPTGAFSIRSLAVVQSLGYKNVHWSFAYMDWETDAQPDVAASLKRVKDYAHSGAIYLLHAISTTNASLLGDAIDFFKAEGYQIQLFQ